MTPNELAQQTLCEEWGSPYMPAGPHLKIGIASNVREGIFPINGLRHNPGGSLSGWYIWAGEELSQAEDFFLPLHIEHLDEWCPAVKRFLGLGPGWRFLLAPGHEDVWFDPSLLVD